MSQGTSQSFNRPFGGAIGRDLSVNRSPPAGAEIDNHAASFFNHGGQKMPNDVDDALDVHVNHLIKLGSRDFPKEGILIDNGGVIEQQIGRTMTFEQALGPDMDLFIVGYVDGSEIVWLRVMLTQFINATLGSTASYDRVTQGDKLLGQGKTEPAGDTSNEDLFVETYGRNTGNGYFAPARVLALARPGARVGAGQGRVPR